MHTDLAAKKDGWIAANLGIGRRRFTPNISERIRVNPCISVVKNE
jgi:hypothetical protein